MKAYKVWYGESAKNCIFSMAETFKQAVGAIANNEETIKRIKSATVGITMVDCGKCHCGRLATKEVLDDIGECLMCEKLRHDAQQERYEEETDEVEEDEM